jgi:hypothetical protein
MSTSSGIALKQGETFITIYCHWDGHPKTMLPILRNNYNSFELANKLISMGDASSINKKLMPTLGVTHTFMSPEEDVCVFYHRDRDDDWLSCQPACYTKQELFKQPSFEFVHIFEDGTWNSYNMNGGKIRL